MIQNGTHIKSSRWNSVENAIISIWFQKMFFFWDVLPRAGETSREITRFGKFNPKSLAPVEIPAWTTITITYKQIGIQCQKWTCHLKQWSSDVVSVLESWVGDTFVSSLCHGCTKEYHGWNPENLSFDLNGGPTSLKIDPLQSEHHKLMFPMRLWVQIPKHHIISKGVCIKPLHGEISQHLDVIRPYWT